MIEPEESEGRQERIQELSPEDGPHLDETPEDPQANNVSRALKAAIFGLLLFPLEFYATFLIIKIFTSFRLVPNAARSKLFWACAVNLGFYTTLLAMFVTTLLPRHSEKSVSVADRRQDDLRLLDHPPGLAGSWEFKSPGGKDHLEL